MSRPRSARRTDRGRAAHPGPAYRRPRAEPGDLEIEVENEDGKAFVSLRGPDGAGVVLSMPRRLLPRFFAVVLEGVGSGAATRLPGDLSVAAPRVPE